METWILYVFLVVNHYGIDILDDHTQAHETLEACKENGEFFIKTFEPAKKPWRIRMSYVCLPKTSDSE